MLQVKTVIQHAKLDESDLLAGTQVLCFNQQLLGDEIKLLEVNFCYGPF